jgi:hypothetical protein
LTDNAIAIETAKGSPSGIATIIKTTETIAELPIFKSIELENTPLSSSSPKNANARLKRIKDKKQIIVAV